MALDQCSTALVRDRVRISLHTGEPMDHRQRMGPFRQAEAMLVAQAPIIPLLYGKREWLLKPWLKNIQPISFGNLPTHHAIVEPH